MNRVYEFSEVKISKHGVHPTLKINYLRMNNKVLLPLAVACLSFALLAVTQLKLSPPVLILERFYPGGGWVQIVFLALYGFFLSKKMMNPRESAKWRKISWMLFSLVFFCQLLAGIFLDEKFLMSGKLHFPIPSVILTGTLYRWQLSFMPLLFIITLILSGPAWCSHLCYFGSIDLWVAGKGRGTFIRHLVGMKFVLLFLFMLSAILLRLLGATADVAGFVALGSGVAGVLVILFISGKNKSMVHCSVYCPIGTLVAYLKYLNPFRIRIENTCNQCMRCISHCKYNALSKENIEKRKPAISCTYCGDCIVSCERESLRYVFLNLNATAARNLWIIITVSLHVVFLGLAKI